MKIPTCLASPCRNCQFFSPDGTRYGNCNQLNVAVDGKWSRCNLGTVAFQTINR